MKNFAVARRYARALYDLALENNSADDVLLSMSNLNLAMKDAPQFLKALLNPTLKAEDKEKLVKTVTSNKLVINFIHLLEQRKRLDLLPEVHEQLVSLSDESKGIKRAVVRTAAVLSEDQKKDVEAKLARSLGGRIIGKFEVQQELIGGVWVKLGDHVLDASLKRRVEDFRDALVHSAN